MKIEFYKYQGTGNDFIILDNRENKWQLLKNQIAKLCDRRFGIGADGLMLLEKHPQLDFEMRYFNADGGEASMCGNGGRCMVSFAHQLGACAEIAKFMAVDGIHEAIVKKDGIVELKMLDVQDVAQIWNGYFTDTGSPHFVNFVDGIENYDVFSKGKEIRYHKHFAPDGCNANFVEEINPSTIQVRTYERGVENETLSCGTGVVASALATFTKNKLDIDEYAIITSGGNLTVRFMPILTGNFYAFKNIWLCGPAEFVFSGTIKIQE
ncbi:MAG: diaminopimelate epimerase [Bacteroidales bacterium]|nr:diaminopimelate epimerase [Bacteroidales bacterium]MCF8456457.1 diaminopimelate epimerase [Bacteroidales bacterium]